MTDEQSVDSAFRRLVETAGCMIVILRADHTVAYFNPFAEQTTGYSANEVLGKDYFDIFLERDTHASVAAEIKRTLAGGKPSVGYENAVRCRDGSLCWMAWNAQRVDEYQGTPALLAVGHDVTDQRNASQAIRNQEAHLRAVLDTAVDGIITIDDRGIIQSFNPSAERIFGYSADEAIGRNVSMLMPVPYRDEHDGYIANYLKTGDAKIIGIGRQVVGLRKDGLTFPIDLAVSEVPLAGRRVFTGIIRDITVQKRAEERALQAERLAAIGQTVTGLAHESRNAFQRSQACLEMLAMELEDRPEEMELVERIQRALDHLHHLYEEVRDYAAPIKLDRQLCDLAHVWRDSWSHLELVRKQKQVELFEETAGIDLSCEVDWFQLGQVFRNILENAVAACPNPGRIRIHAGTSELDGKPAVTVSVIDDGPGFEPQAKAKVFDAFFTTKTKGTGLGMAIARRIIEAHGGRIAIGDSTAGAEIVVTLPRGNI